MLKLVALKMIYNIRQGNFKKLKEILMKGEHLNKIKSNRLREYPQGIVNYNKKITNTKRE